MRYLHGKLKVKRGGIINVTVSKPTRILIMTDREFKKYKNNMSFTYFGGQKDDSYELNVPKTDVWHVVVEKGSYANPVDITASVTTTHAAPAKRKPARAIATSFAEADHIMEEEEEAVEEVESAKDEDDSEDEKDN